MFYRKDIQDKKLIPFWNDIHDTQLILWREDIQDMKPIFFRTDTFRRQSKEIYSGCKSIFLRKVIQDKSLYFLGEIFMMEGQYFGRNSSAESFNSEY